MNKGTLDKIFIAFESSKFTGSVSIKLPENIATKYNDNKSFIVGLARAWQWYISTHEVKNKYITPLLLYHHLAQYNISTNKNEGYAPNSRGPFNLIRAAYRGCDRMEQEAISKGCSDTAKIMNKLKRNIAVTFINAKGEYAYEY